MDTPTRPILLTLSVGALFLLLLSYTGCATSGPPEGSAPEDMSAEEHRAEAQREQQLADEHDARYEPSASIRGTGGFAGKEVPLGLGYAHNPTEKHLAEAQEHRAHAEAHQKAAAALESFEDAQCEPFEPKTRVACPLLGTIEATSQTPEGVTLHVADGVEIDAMLSHIQCHLAFARTRGFEGMDMCPLYLKGVSAERVGDDIVLELSDDAPTSLSELRARVHSHVEPPAESATR